ncbi:hypothetical protein GCM10009677_07530 [Sphaerisporangium rubeum]
MIEVEPSGPSPGQPDEASEDFSEGSAARLRASASERTSFTTATMTTVATTAGGINADNTSFIDPRSTWGADSPCPPR